MPKFLDAPSWYDSDGVLREIAGYYSVGASYGAFQIPALSEAAPYFVYGSRFYVSTTPPGNGQVCVSSSGFLTMTSGGAAGNVLRKNAHGAVIWDELDKTYVYRGHISGGGVGTLQCLFFTDLTPVQNNIHFSTAEEAVACTVILPSVWENDYFPYRISTVSGMGSAYYLYCISFNAGGTSTMSLPSSWWNQYCVVDQTVATYVKTE